MLLSSTPVFFGIILLSELGSANKSNRFLESLLSRAHENISQNDSLIAPKVQAEFNKDMRNPYNILHDKLIPEIIASSSLNEDMSNRLVTSLLHEAISLQIQNLQESQKSVEEVLQSELKLFKTAMLSYLENPEQVKQLYNAFLMLATIRDLLSVAATHQQNFEEHPDKLFEMCNEELLNATTLEFCKSIRAPHKRRLELLGGLAYRVADAFDTLLYGDTTILGRLLGVRQGPLSGLFRSRIF